MRIYLLLCFLVTTVATSFAQQQAVITGDEMLCSGGTGTAMVQGIVPYDTYQWQVKAYGETEFADIEGATESSFTYDAYTYSVTYIRCEVSQDGETFVSNELFIDSMVSLPIYVVSESEGDVTPDGQGGYLMCPGGTITNTVSSGYGNVQWYKDEQPIAGANGQSYIITAPGVYYASAQNEDCPNGTVFTLETYVSANSNCVDNTPVIEGDTLLCPSGLGTATVTNDVEYDTYQWQQLAYLADDYVDVEGATEATFTYDQYNYAVTDIRVKVTLDGETYYSNELFIDSMAFSGLIVEHSWDEGMVTQNPDNGNYNLCVGATITNTVTEPYTIVQWYKDGVAIEGATDMVFVLSEPGEYYVVASPEACPTFVETLPPFTVVANTDCTAGLNNPNAAAFSLYPNPANNTLNLSLPQGTALESYTIVDVTGKTLLSGTLNGTEPQVNIEALAAGSYIIKVAGQNAQASKMFVKQ